MGNKFQSDDLLDERPAAADAAASAVQRFVTTFVIATKRERVLAMLLHHDRNRRSDAIEAVYKWVDPKLQAELDGNAGFPQQLKQRFGNLRGIVIDETSARHVTVAGAASVAARGSAASFIADAMPIALLFPEVGPPTLCSRG